MTRANSAQSELERVAASISDGEALDRGLLESLDGCDPDTRAALGKLDLISRAFRSGNAKSRRSKRDEVVFRFAGLDAIKKIAEGGQGEIWLARDPALKRDVALKIQKESSVGALNAVIEEGRRLARLNHPHVVRIYGAAVDGGRSGVWMELVKGESMQARRARMGPLDAKDVASMALDVCSALIAVHDQGFAHGDIKPDNVLQDEDGRTVLIDFGSARNFSSEPSSNISGTRAYAAPEILEGGATGPAADIYALAMLMFHLLAARSPQDILVAPSLRSHGRFDSEKCAPRRTKGRENFAHATASGVPALMADLIERGISQNPSQRPKSALCFRADLQRVVDSNSRC